MKKIKVCATCGGKMVRHGIDTGYDRKEGDTFAIYICCEKCGGVGTKEVLEPCHVCGSQNPDKEINACSKMEELIGCYDWVPGFPNIVNICSGCEPELNKKVQSAIDKTYDDCGFE